MTETEPPSLPTDAQANGIAGFWRRVLAFSIDVLLLGMIGFILGLFFFDQFARLGAWGRLIGFFVCLLYFGCMNSALAGGKTLGKRLLKIQVVDVEDKSICLPRSCVRFVILALPYFTNSLPLPRAILLSWIGYVLGVIIFGLGLSIVYLLVFNRRNRRSVHDLITGTYVTKVGTQSSGSKPRMWFGHYAVVGLLFAGAVVFPVFARGMINKAPFKDIVALQSKLTEQPNVQFAAVNIGTNYFWAQGGKQTADFLTATIHTAQRVKDYDSFRNAIAKVIFDNYSEARRKDRIIINIVYGYDIGIASGNVSQGYNYSPSEWQQRISGR